MFSKLKALAQMQAMRQSMLLLLIFFVCLIITGLASILVAEFSFRSELKQELKLQHQINLKLISQPQRIAEKSQYLSNTEIAFKDHTGKVFGNQNPKLFKKLGFFERSNLNPIAQEFKKSDDQDWLVYSSQEAKGQLSTAINITEAVTEPIEVFTSAFLVLGASVGMAGLCAGLYVGLRDQRRFQQISQQLSAIASGDLNQRISAAPRNDDLGHIASQLNQTTEQLATLIHQIKHLTQNIAHDLKTPLTRLRVQLEQSLNALEANMETNLAGNIRAEPQQQQAALESAITQTDQIITTFDAILKIARLQAQHKHKPQTQVSLAVLSTDIYELYKEHAEDLDFHLSLSTSYQPKVSGDPNLLSQLLANLIENALRYCPSGSHIQIETLQDGIAVSDNGPGIPDSEYERVLQPMYQIDKSRNLGTGLGLAMVKAIADYHGAQLELSPIKIANKNKGLRVTLRFI